MTDLEVEPLGSSTPKYALRYPAATDPADVPLDMQKLASDVEAAITGVTLYGAYTARPAANTVKSGTLYMAYDSMGTWWTDGINWILISQGSPIIQPATLSNPPFNQPYNGMRVTLLVDGTNGIEWSFVYNAGSGSQYKWEYTGGTPLENGGQDQVALPGPGWYSILPFVVTPRGGEYRVELIQMYASAPAGTLCAAGTAESTAGSPRWAFNTTATVGNLVSGFADEWRIAYNPGVSIGTFFYAAGPSGNVGSRMVRVTPLRIG